MSGHSAEERYVGALVLLQLGALAIITTALHRWAFSVGAGAPTTPYAVFWRPSSLADAIWTWAVLGLLLGPATALVMTPLMEFYRAA